MRHALIMGVVLLSGVAASHAGRLLLPFLTPESQSNVIVAAVPGHPIPCPQEYTNLISNTNLFTPSQQRLIKELPLKYAEVTSNSGPAGTVFEGIERRQWKFRGVIIKTFNVSCFVYTNSDAREEISFESAGTISVNFRTKSGDGYYLHLVNSMLSPYDEYKHDVLDGICVGQGFDKEHCNVLGHFANGKLVGKYLGWDRSGELVFEAEFKEPLDISTNSLAPIDETWEKMKSLRRP